MDKPIHATAIPDMMAVFSEPETVFFTTTVDFCVVTPVTPVMFDAAAAFASLAASTFSLAVKPVASPAGFSRKVFKAVAPAVAAAAVVLT